MRPIILCMFWLLVLFGFAFSFSASDYFYAGEENVSVSYANFSLNGSSFSIVSINGSEAFLLKEGEIVREPEAIREILKTHYIEQYYPSESELSELRSLVEEYNSSRNNGYGNFKNQEEYSCREAIFTDKRIDVVLSNKSHEKLWCHDDETCEINAKLLYSFGYEVFRWPSYTILIQPLKDFSFSSYGTDEILSNFTYKLDNMDENTVADTLAYIKNSIPVLKSYADKMESSIFRYPRMNDSADKAACKNVCYAICPPMDIDQEESLMRLKTRADALYAKIEPLAKLDGTVATLTNNTIARLNFYENKITSARYDALFSPLEEKGIAAEEKAKEAYLRIVSINLGMKTEEAQELRTSIRERIENANFTNLDEDISAYEQLIAALESKTAEVQGIYEDLTAAKKATTAVLLDLSSQDLGADDEKKYDDLKSKLASLDELLVPGLAPDKATELKQEYVALADEALELRDSIKANPASVTASPLRAMATKTTEWLAETATKTSISDNYSILENRSVFFGGFATLMFISFSSILFMLFLTTLKFRRSRRFVFASGAIFVLLVLAAAVVSSFLFFFMNDTSTDATLNEFLNDLSTKDTVAVVVDTQLATASEEKEMKNCASAIAEVLNGQNKTADIFVQTSNASITDVNGSQVDYSSLDSYGAVIFLLPAPEIEKPKFSTIFHTSATIKSTEDYYELCSIAEMLKE